MVYVYRSITDLQRGPRWIERASKRVILEEGANVRDLMLKP